jgi:hypothetical protein
MGLLERSLIGVGACAVLSVFWAPPAHAQAAPATTHPELAASGASSVPVLPSGLYFAPFEPRATSWMFTIAPAIGIQAGSETYEFHANVPSTMSLDVVVRTKLRYPVASGVAGGSLFFGVDSLGFSGTFLTNVGDPWSTLVDQDFLSASDGVNAETIEFSHTDSPTTLRTYDVEGAARIRIGRPAVGKTTALHAVAGFRFERSTYDAYGASGWQLDSDGSRQYASIPGAPHALHYEVRYRQPFLGVGLNVGAGEPFLFSGEARLLASWSSHEDDHVLRHKAAEASAFGGGAALRLEPAFVLGGFPGLRFLAGLSAQLQVVGSFNGVLRQHYYADDPTIDGDQTNQAIPDSEFSFLSLRVRLLAFLGARF